LKSTSKSVLVVGAGPAGATAALALAKAGVTVRLLDRSNFPRNKPCGGGISLRVLRRFPYLERELGRIATHTVGRLHLEGPDGDSTIIDAGEAAALLIRRVEFDALLVSLAVEAGAELVPRVDIVQAAMDDDRVVLTARDGRRFDAPFVIAADGVYSVIARRLGLNPGWPARSMALDMMEETPRASLQEADPSMLWVSYGFDRDRNRGGNSDRRAPEGYAYIFPKRDHVNVGVGYVLDHYRRSIDAAPYDVQRGFVDDLAGRGIIAGESVRANFTPFQIPVGGPLKRPGAGRVLLAGDAGGFVNGFTAEGIYYAMVSGEHAARTIATLPPGAHRSLAGRYRRACNYEIGAELRESVLIQRYLFADRRRIAKVIEGATRAPAMTRAILDFAIGRLRYAQLRRRLLLGAPLLAGRLVWEQLKELGTSLRGFGPGTESAGS
jgi:geranylgeranyl reductase family protein